MKVSCVIFLTLLAGCSARVHPKLRGIAKEEEKEYYELMMQQEIGSVPPPTTRTAEPTPTPPPTSAPQSTPTPPPTPPPQSTPTPPPTANPTKAATPNPTRSPTKAPIVYTGPPTEAPTACSFAYDNCPEACFEVNENERPLKCTDNDIQRPDCNALPFPPFENCPLCCPDDCEEKLACSPTPVPSPEPSPAPSPVPTPCRDLTVLCPERCWEVDPFNRLPMCIDFNRPDCDTLPFPEDGCPTCCPTQCMDAPELGDCSPTPVPTATASLEPTQCIPPPGCPSTCADVDTPNSLCSAECIACPPVDCEVDILITPACPDLSCGWDVCDSAPTSMTFLYQGGDCTSSVFERCAPGSADLCTCARSAVEEGLFPAGFSCNDLNGGPPSPTQVQARSWIQVLAGSKDGGTIFFEGPVRIGTSFNVTDPSGLPLSSQIVVRVFEFDAAANGPGDALQVVSMDGTCNDMYLTDKFGASRVVEFTDQNSMGTLFQDTPVEYTLSLKADTDATQLELSTANIVLLSPGNFGRLSGPQLGNVDVTGLSVPPTQVLNTDFVTVPDEDHRILASFGGMVDGRECFGIQESLFSCPSS